MRRPSKEQVDGAIALVRGGLEAADPDEWSAHDILATEVQALREELATLEKENVYLVDKQNRVETLAKDWLTTAASAEPLGNAYEGEVYVLTSCAKQLERACFAWATSEPNSAPKAASVDMSKGSK
jgi:hypothetical protein